MIALTLTLAKEFAGMGITIEPGFTETEMIQSYTETVARRI